MIFLKNISSLDKVNYLNVFLMIISMICAVSLPFECFLFSYAVLGPLHYLTEISWLHEKKYFLPQKFDYRILILLGILLALGQSSFMPEKSFLTQYNLLGFFATFFLTFIFIITSDWKYRLLFILSIPILSIALLFNKFLFLFFAVYLITLVHVYIFTGIFIFNGVRKTPNLSGNLSLLVYILAPIICFSIPVLVQPYFSNWVKDSYIPTFGHFSFTSLTQVFGLKNVKIMDIFTHPLSIKLARFVAFAYTYHYLNWFSKTSIIKWHKVTKFRFNMIIILWILAVAIYGYNYLIGYQILFILSYIHVILEFPLNHHSFILLKNNLFLKKIKS